MDFNELVVANRILASENVVDAYGHVSLRHPEDPKRFFLSRSLAPQLVEPGDIMEFDLEGNGAAGGDGGGARACGGRAALRRDRRAAAAGDPLRQLHGRARAGVGHPRPLRRHEPAARKQYRADARPRLRRRGPLADREIEARNAGYKPYSPETWRAWEYWATRAGCAHLLRKRDG